MHFLSMSMLGSFQVTMDGVDVEGFEYNKVKGLLAYLAIESDRSHHRELLAEIFWPDRPAQMARNSLRQALSILRNAIHDRSAQVPFLIISRDTVQFNRRSDYWLDINVFIDSVTACRESLRRGGERGANTCVHWFRQSARLYRGDFLDQFLISDSPPFTEWAAAKRQEYRRQAIEVFSLLSSYYEKSGDYDDALNYARRQVGLDGTQEEAHRKIIRIYYQLGDRSAAMNQYDECVQMLDSELGVKPEEETQELFERIRNRQSVVPDSPNGKPVDFLTRPHYIPLEHTPLIGRDRDISELTKMLENSDCRLITILGPGGIGKTRIAQRLAAERLEDYVDGAFFVVLAHLNSAESIVSAMSDTLSPGNYGDDDWLTRFPLILKEKQLLLVLDNFEHVLEGRSIVQDILDQAPGVKIVITSRERLDLTGEYLYEPDGLKYPESDNIEEIESYSSVQLFVKTAHRFRPTFVLSEKDKQPVAKICRLLEGNPLAIELAASWIRLLECEEIATEIDRNLDFLGTNSRDIPSRHRSIRAVFQNSWSLLSEDERTKFAHLSVFRGGFTREDSENLVAYMKSLWNFNSLSCQGPRHMSCMH